MRSLVLVSSLLLGTTGAALTATGDGTSSANRALPTGLAGRLVSHFHMTLVPQEGVWFSVSYVSEDELAGAALPPRYAGRAHAAGSAILVVATPRDFSALHRLQTDEVWHFYGGAPVKMLLLYPDGRGRTVTLGSDVLAGQVPQFTVPHGVWQGAAPQTASPNAYSLVGTQMSPGFDYADFEIGYRDDLTRQYPNFSAEIARLTRPEFAHDAGAAASRSNDAVSSADDCDLRPHGCAVAPIRR